MITATEYDVALIGFRVSDMAGIMRHAVGIVGAR
jgi:hypothetical protein